MNTESAMEKLSRLINNVAVLQDIADGSRKHNDYANLRTAQTVLKAHQALANRLERAS